MVTSTQATTAAYRHNPFTEEHEMFRKSVRAFVEKELNPHCDEWEEAGIWPAHEVLKKMGNLGFLGLNYDEQYGGANADIWFTVVLCEELGRCQCAGVPMGITGAYGYVYPCPGEVWQP